MAQTDEQQIAAQRLKDLEAQASTANAEMQAAKSAAAAVKGDLDRANTELAGLRDQNARLTEQVRQLSTAAAAKDLLPTLPVELPKGASQLTESVTMTAVDAEGKPMRAHARRGDVVLVGKAEDAEALQGAIGTTVRVWPVDKTMAAELRKLNHLR